MKMDSFKRKYFTIARGEEKCQTRKWRHFKTLEAIFGNQEKRSEESVDSDEPVANQSRKSRSSRRNISDKPFNQVYVDECTSLLLDEEDCTPPSSYTSEVYQEPPAKKQRQSEIRQGPARQQRSSSAANSKQNVQNSKPSALYTKAGKLRQPKRPRRNWTVEEEVTFIEVWKNYVGDLLGERKKKADVYRSMKNELQKLGVGLDKIASDFKAKVESLKRTFKSEHENFGAKSEWIHYARLVDVVGPLNGILIETHQDTSSSSDDWFPHKTEAESSSKLADPFDEEQQQDANDSDDSFYWVLDKPTEEAEEAEEALSSHSEHPNDSATNQILEQTDEEYSPVQSPVQFNESNSANNNDSEICEGHTQNLEETEETGESPKQPSSHRKKSVEQFTQFVAKELLELDDDLFLEAKRCIYDVLYKMERKQLQLNKH